MRSIMWESADFLMHVVGEAEKKDTITLTYVCIHCKLLQCRRLLGVGHHQPRRQEADQQLERLVVWIVWTATTLENIPTGSLQVGDTVHEQIAFSAHAALDGEGDNKICTLKLITNLMKGNTLVVVVSSLEEGNKETFTDALRHFISADNNTSLVTTVELVKHKAAKGRVCPKFDFESYLHAVHGKRTWNVKCFLKHGDSA